MRIQTYGRHCEKCRWCRAALPGGGTWCPWPAQCHAEEAEDKRVQAAKAKEGA